MTTPAADELVEDAEQEAREAAALAETLEERVRDGDESVGPEQLEKARSLAGFLRLRQEAAARKAERAREAARLKACEELAAEVEAYSTDNGPRYAELRQDVVDAVTAFTTALGDRNERIQEWLRRATELGVPTAPRAQREHGRLGWNGNNGPTIFARDVTLSHAPAVNYLNRLLGAVQVRQVLNPRVEASTWGWETVIEDLAAIDRQRS
jgi:hypothetical protein